MTQKAESGDFIKVIADEENQRYKVGDILEVDMRASSMGACDDDSVFTVNGHCLLDSEYVIHKSLYPSEEKLREQLLQHVKGLNFAQLKALARNRGIY